MDDSPVQRAAIAIPLRDAGYDVTEAGTGAEAMAAVRATRPDVLLLDLGLPDRDGLDVLRALRSVEDVERTAVVIISDRVDVADVASGLNAGAHDYLRKPVETGELLARVMAAGRAKRLQDDVLDRGEALEQALRTDPVTGLPNRLQLEEHLGMWVSLARRHGLPLGVVLLDVDHFRDVNEGGSQPQGDAILARVAHAARATLRQEDVIGRWGGDEFLVLLLGPRAVDVRVPASRVLDAVRALPPLDGRRVMSVSAGGAVLIAGEDRDDLLRRAGAALYAAKASGGDMAVIAAEG